MAQLYDKYGLDDNSQNFIGHAMALRTDDGYLKRPAEDTVRAVQLYGQSMGRYGQDGPSCRRKTDLLWENAAL